MKRTAEAKIHHWVTETMQGRLPVRLHFRNDLHVVRKIWHMAMGMFIAFVYWSGMPATTAVIILASFLGADLIIESARLRMPSFNDKIMRIWGPFMRACEVDRISGIPYYLLSSLIAVAIFPKPVAILSILYLACGDPIASFFGILYGKHGIRLASGKSLIGTLAGVVTCTVVSFLFLKALPVSDDKVVILSIIGGIAGGTAELLPFDLDDNFTIPVISGFVMWLAFMVIGA